MMRVDFAGAVAIIHDDAASAGGLFVGDRAMFRKGRLVVIGEQLGWEDGDAVTGLLTYGDSTKAQTAANHLARALRAKTVRGNPLSAVLVAGVGAAVILSGAALTVASMARAQHPTTNETSMAADLGAQREPPHSGGESAAAAIERAEANIRALAGQPQAATGESGNFVPFGK